MKLGYQAVIVCILLLNGAFAQEFNVENKTLKDAALKDGFGVIWTGLNDLDFSSMPEREALQASIDGVSDGDIHHIPSGHYSIEVPLYINKNLSLVGDGPVVLDAHRTCEILQTNNPNSVVSLENIVFVNGENVSGGAIYSAAKELKLKNCSFSNNVAYNGACIYQVDGTSLDVIGCNFGHNGAVSNYIVAITEVDTHIGNGGCIFSAGGAINIVDSTLDNNFAFGHGGAVYSNASPSYGVNIRPAAFVVRNSSFCSNVATETGAAIYNDHNELSLKSSVFDENSGAGAIVSLNEKMIVQNCSISNNLGPLNMDNYGDGGGIICRYGSMLMENSRVNGNKAHYDGDCGFGGHGGGMVLYRSNVTLNNTTVDGNLAWAMTGICSDLCNLVVNSGSISNNTADQSIGGLFAYGHTTLNGVVLRGNRAEDGGAIVADGTLNITGKTLIYGNVAENGAGIFNSASNVTISPGVVISNNTANKGAAIYNEGAIFIVTDNLYHEGTIVLNGTSITGNNATYGSAIYNDGNATLIGCEIKDNNASIGGSIWNVKHMVVRDSTIDDLGKPQESNPATDLAVV